jgi:hypothetical protein
MREPTYGHAPEGLNVKLPTGEFRWMILKYRSSMSPGRKRIGDTGGVEVQEKILYTVLFGEREIFARLNDGQRRVRNAYAHEAI